MHTAGSLYGIIWHNELKSEEKNLMLKAFHQCKRSIVPSIVLLSDIVDLYFTRTACIRRKISEEL